MSTGGSGPGPPFPPKNRIRLIFQRKNLFKNGPKLPPFTAPSDEFSTNAGYHHRPASPSPQEEQEPQTYRSPFRLYVVPKSPKRQKRSSSPAPSTRVMSGLVIELWLFLRAYTGFKEHAVFEVLEGVFRDLDWEECAEMDEAQAAVELNLYDAEDGDDGSERAALKRMVTRILELPERRITTAFGELMVRMREEGYSGTGFLIPPEIKAEEEEKKSTVPVSTLLQSSLSWRISCDNGSTLEPVMRQVVPEPDQPHPYDIDSDDPAILKERQEYYDGHLKEDAEKELEHQLMCQQRALERQLVDEENYQRACKRRYWELVAHQDALAVEQHRKLPIEQHDPLDEEGADFTLDDIVSVVSTDENWSTESDEVKASELTRGRKKKSPEKSVAGIPEKSLRWAMDIGQKSLDNADDESNERGRKLRSDLIPGLAPFPPPPILRVVSPKRKACEAGLDDRHVMFDLNQGWEGQPKSAEEEQRMLEQAIRESMMDTNPWQSQCLSPPKAQSPSECQLPIDGGHEGDKGSQLDTEMGGMGQQESGVVGLGIAVGEIAQASEPGKANLSLQQLARRASVQVDDLTVGMDSLATLTPPAPTPMEISPVVFASQEEEIDRLVQLKSEVTKNVQMVEEQRKRLIELTAHHMRHPTLTRSTASLGSGMLKAVSDADDVAVKHFSKAMLEGRFWKTTGKEEGDGVEAAESGGEAPVPEMPVARMPDARMPVARMLWDLKEEKEREREKMERDKVNWQWKVLWENKARWRREDEEYRALEQKCYDEAEEREKEDEEAGRMQGDAKKEKDGNVWCEEKVESENEGRSTARRLSQALEAEHKSFTDSDEDKEEKGNEKEDEVMKMEFDDETDSYEKKEESDKNEKHEKGVESDEEEKSMARRLSQALEAEHDDYADCDEDEAELTQAEIQAIINDSIKALEDEGELTQAEIQDIINDSMNAAAETENAANAEKERRGTELVQTVVGEILMERERMQMGFIPTDMDSRIRASMVMQSEIEDTTERGMEGVEMEVRTLESQGELTQAEIEEILWQSRDRSRAQMGKTEVAESVGKAEEAAVGVVGTAQVVYLETAQAVLETAPVVAVGSEREVDKERGEVTVTIEEVSGDEEMGGV